MPGWPANFIDDPDEAMNLKLRGSAALSLSGGSGGGGAVPANAIQLDDGTYVVDVDSGDYIITE